MKRYEGSPAVVIERRKGTPDSPFSNINETLVVTGDGKVLLSEIPNELNRVIVTSEDNATWYEITEGQIPENGFKVDYINKLVTFNSKHVGKQLYFKYLGEGNHYYSVHSIYTKLEDKTVVETLGDIIDGGKDALDALGSLNEKLLEVTEATNNAITATEDTISATNDARDVTDRGNQVIDNASNKIEEMDSRIGIVDEKMTIADSKLSTVDDALLEMNNTIQNANQSIEDVNSLITDGQSVINEVEQVTSNAQLLIDETKSVGEFILSNQYKRNNTVLHNGSTWIALQNTKDNPLPILPSRENAYWRLVAQRGIDGTGSVVSVNGQSPNTEGDVVISATNVGAFTKEETETAIENAMETLEGLGYNTKSVARLTETQYKDQQNTGHFYVSPDNSGFLPEQETFFGTISKHLSSGSSFTLYELVRLSSGITYTRCVINDGANDLADTGWIESGGGAGGGGTGTTSVNAIKLSTTTVGQVDWNIPSGTFDPSTDSLLVFHNGVYLPSASWSLKGIAPNHILSIPDNPESLKGKIENNNVSIAIFRNMPFGDTETIEGTRITPATIGMDRLEQSLQDMINGGGAEIVNNLVTDDPNKTLSAAMGVAIKAMIDAIPTTYFSSSLTLDDETKAATSKAVKQLNDAKLNLTGGTMTGNLTIDKPDGQIQFYGKGSDGLVKTTQIRHRTNESNTSKGIDFLIDGALALRISADRSVAFIDNNGVMDSLQGLKQSVVDGKSKVAAAITTKGVTTAADVTFDTMATNIGKIPTGRKIQTGNVTFSGSPLTGSFDYANGTGSEILNYAYLDLPSDFNVDKIVLVGYNTDGYVMTILINMDIDFYYNNGTMKLSSYQGGRGTSQFTNLNLRVKKDNAQPNRFILASFFPITYNYTAFSK
ncbi:hypothetical protein GAG94_03685 [Lysinibacillus sphaericus]|nr:hypothetical protein GAG94_03685 [Lysinibacillus sphaericus]